MVASTLARKPPILSEEMSQVEFAKQLGISRSHLCDIEKGRKSVSVARAARFAKILGYGEASSYDSLCRDLWRNRVSD